MKVTKTEAGLFAVDVDGDTYEFERWGAEDALDTLMDISSIVGTPLSAAAAAAFGKGGDGVKTELTDDLIERVVGELTRNMRQHKAMCLAIFKKLAGRRVLCNGRPVNYDQDYAGDRLRRLFLVVRAGFTVQYGDFCAAVLGSNARAPAALASTQGP